MKFSRLDTVNDIKWALQDSVQINKMSPFFWNTFDFDPDSYDLFDVGGKTEDDSIIFDSYAGITSRLWIGILKTEESDNMEDSKH